jgi:hypothetical protein
MNSVMKKLNQAGTYVNVLLYRRSRFLNLEAARIAEQAPHFARFQARTGRTLPTAILSERSSTE